MVTCHVLNKFVLWNNGQSTKRKRIHDKSCWLKQQLLWCAGTNLTSAQVSNFHNPSNRKGGRETEQLHPWEPHSVLQRQNCWGRDCSLGETWVSWGYVSSLVLGSLCIFYHVGTEATWGGFKELVCKLLRLEPHFLASGSLHASFLNGDWCWVLPNTGKQDPGNRYLNMHPGQPLAAGQ